MTAPTSTQPTHRPSTAAPSARAAAPLGRTLTLGSSAHNTPEEQRSIGFDPLTLLATIAVAMTTLVTAISFCRVFPNWAFLAPMAATIIVVHLVLGVCRWFHRGLIVSWSIAFAALAVALGLFYFPDTLALVVPTKATWDAAWQSVADSFSTFQTTVAPVPSDGGYALGVTFGLSLVAMVSDTFAFRAFGRVESIIPSALMFALAASLGVDRNRTAVTAAWLAAIVVAIAFLRAAHSESTLPWLGSGQRERTMAIVGGAGVLAVGAIIGGVVLGPRLPGAEDEAIIDTRNRNGGSSTIVSPLVSVQARLVNRSNVELFTVRSDEDSYWRLTALSEFDGNNWTQTSAYNDDLRDAFVGSGSDLMRQEFQVAELGESFAPAAFSIVDVRSTESLGFDSDTSTLIRRDKLFTGMNYVVESAIPSYTVDELRSATVGRTSVSAQYLQLPSDFADELSDTARAIAGNQPTPYDQVIALQQWFQSEFDYNVNVPRGNGERAMQSFINSREGYCEQFSSTFAAFARVLGVPSRVVVGFTPGDRDASGLLHVRGKHAHAWPEVYFDDLGWVMFEPTPGRGAPGAEEWTGRQAEQAGGVLTSEADTPSERGEPQPTTANPTGTTLPRTIPTLPREPAERTRPGVTIPPLGVTSADSVPRPLIALGLIVGLFGLWLTCMPPIARWWTRRRVGKDPAARVTDSWSRSAMALSLLDAGHHHDETPFEHADRAWRVAGLDQKLLVDLAAAATRAMFAAELVEPKTAQRCEDDSHRVARLVRARADMSRRVAARVNPVVASRMP